MASNSTCFTKEELRKLYKKAKVFNRSSWDANQCKFMYRNRNKSYWDDIVRDNDGVIPVTLKDDGGDPRNPINSELSGIYFLANVQYNDPVPDSPFGDTRWLVKIDKVCEQLKNEHGSGPKLYFCDFFCMYNAHYVSLVLTKPGSEADQFSAQNLFELEFDNNPFFSHNPYGQGYQVSGKTWVEIFVTEELHMDMGKRKKKNYGQGSSTPGGFPKNPSCDKCNL